MGSEIPLEFDSLLQVNLSSNSGLRGYSSGLSNDFEANHARAEIAFSLVGPFDTFGQETSANIWSM